jgi:aromatic ring-cleaving dioxygenase
MPPSAPYHAHIYYSDAERPLAAALRDALSHAEPASSLAAIAFIGALRDGKVGPHPISQFEIHFGEDLLPTIEAEMKRSGLRILIHPLTLDDLADHTVLGRWIGEPFELDLSVLDPPGVNQGIARFGVTDR